MQDFLNTHADSAGIVEKLSGWANGLIQLTPNVAAAALLVLVFYALARALSYLLARELRRRDRPALANVGGALLRWSIMALAFLLASTIVLPSLSPGDLLSGLGIGSVAIGFAFKDILQNLLCGILILLRQPFRIGDEIAVDGFEGKVEDIETRATFIRTHDGRRVIIPNATIYGEAFLVETAFDRRRSEYDVGIGCSDDWKEAMRLMTEAAAGCEGVLATPRPEAFPVGIDAYQNTIRLLWWTSPDRAAVLHTRGRVILAAYHALSGAGIDMPYPTTQVLLHDQTEDADGDRAHQREGWPASRGAERSQPRHSRGRENGGLVGSHASR